MIKQAQFLFVEYSYVSREDGYASPPPPPRGQLSFLLIRLVLDYS